MSPDAPDDLSVEPCANGGAVAANGCDAAWRHFAHALISEAHHLAVAVIDDAAATARLRLSGAAPSGPGLPPGPAEALTLGATIGIVGAVMLTPRVIHARG